VVHCLTAPTEVGLACCAAGPLTTEDFFLMQLHAERAQFATDAVKVVERALEEGRCRLAGELLRRFTCRVAASCTTHGPGASAGRHANMFQLPSVGQCRMRRLMVASQNPLHP